MKKVDFAKLSEQYASFLVAAGGVSITVLTLVLTLGAERARPETLSLHQMILEQAKPLAYWRTFLAEALMVATACCFIGAHMMAETAAYFTYSKENSLDRPLGERLFLLASTNIFNAVVLLLFALLLLPPMAAGVDADSVRRLSLFIFAAVAVAALIWMCLAIERRTEILLPLASVRAYVDKVEAIALRVYQARRAARRRRKISPPAPRARVGADRVKRIAFRVLLTCSAVNRNTDKPRVHLACIFIGMAIIVFVWTVIFGFFLRWVGLLNMTLFPIGILTVLSLICSAYIFKDDKEADTRKAGLKETYFFGSAVTISYTSLLIAAYIMLCPPILRWPPIFWWLSIFWWLPVFWWLPILCWLPIIML
jgi:hypothetical protein